MGVMEIPFLLEDIAKDPVTMRNTPRDLRFNFIVHYKRPRETTIVKHLNMSFNEALDVFKKLRNQMQSLNNLEIDFEASIVDVHARANQIAKNFVDVTDDIKKELGH
jgi:hypothetical protein